MVDLIHFKEKLDHAGHYPGFVECNLKRREKRVGLDYFFAEATVFQIDKSNSGSLVVIN